MEGSLLDAADDADDSGRRICRKVTAPWASLLSPPRVIFEESMIFQPLPVSCGA